MAIFTGGKSKAINSPRHLTLRHSRRTVFLNRLAKGLPTTEEDHPPDLGPGEEQLFSFWAPALVAGPLYEITATQKVKAPKNDPLLLISEQSFTVDAPQFSLPKGSVYSTYPPSGYSDEHRILPHVVLNDPHLPWERLGSPSLEKELDKDTRNRVPWLVLLSFTQDELKLKPGSLGAEFKQTATLSVKMTVGQLQGLSNVASPIQDKSKETQAKAGEFIFINPDLFKNLFSQYDASNTRQDATSPYTKNYQFLSHVRSINTTGMAIAGVEDVGIFSIVVCGRAGPMHNKAPETVAVHLLSIEGVEDMTFPSSDKDFVSLCSLHSWNYTVMPPSMLNVFDTFTNLGGTLNVLRPPDTMLEQVGDGDKLSDRLARRLEDGYSLVKYRLPTGEQTVALFRGPFTPTVVSRLSHLNICSNSGQDLQILDQEVGLIDTTYSAAWQLGRVLAVGDQSFTAALSRFRSLLHAQAMKQCKEDAVRKTGSPESFRTRKDVLSNLKETVRHLETLYLSEPSHEQPLVGATSTAIEHSGAGPQKHWWFRRRLRDHQYPYLGRHQRVIEDNYLEYAINAAYDLSLAKDGAVYDETNDPVSTDWMIILAWVLDRMYLAGVPAHYLITDPSHLGPESLRFFHIDPNWVDALIDGALSLGNHMGTDFDRVAIKLAINRFVEHLPPFQPHRPQIPTYGFYLRSDLVTLYPDLKVETEPIPPKGVRPERAPLLRHEIITDGVMLGLFDRVPGSDDFTALRFTQPPHQQCFALSDDLSAEVAHIGIRKQYTVSEEDQEKAPDPDDPADEFDIHPADSDNWFLWGSQPKPRTESTGEDNENNTDNDLGPEDDLRLIRLPRFAQGVLDILNAKMGYVPDEDGNPTNEKYFEDDVATSALLGMQLIDPIYYLQITLKGHESLGSLRGPNPALPGGTSMDSMPRTLQSVEPSVVPDMFLRDHAPPKPAPVARTRGIDAGQPARLIHIPANAPHVRPMITETLEEAMGSYRPHGVPITEAELTRDPAEFDESPSVPGPSDPASPPVFQCNVYTPNRGAVILDENGLKQDLVFSVLLGNNEYSNYRLMEFDIAVPLGPTTKKGNNYFMETYDGPGPTMLSNLRFNVLASFVTLSDPKRTKCLLLRLIPRSRKKWISVKVVEELGFSLCLAKINDYGTRRRMVTLYTSAYYKYRHEKVPLQSSFTISIDKD